MKKYYVTLIDKVNETNLLITNDMEKAIKRAKDEEYYIKRDKRKGDTVEIRIYEHDNFNFFDYNTLDF